jgi:hypothetical protein
MGKGFNSAKSKQLELAKKMALAKKQQRPPDEEQQKGEEVTPADEEEVGEEEKRMQEDRARFEELLRSSKISNPNPLYEDDEVDSFGQQSRRLQSSASITARAGALRAKRAKSNNTSTSSNKAKTKQKKGRNTGKAQEEEEEAEDQPLQEGDIARRHDFEGLVTLDGSALGPMLSAQLVPWVPPFTAEYLVVLADPRAQSSDLRRAIQYVSSNTSPDVLKHVIAINSDEVSETKSWIERVGPQGSDGDRSEGDGDLLRIFSDRDWEWMRRYSAVDDGRWSMTMIIIDTDAVIRKVIRDVEPSQVCQLLAEAIESIK